MAQHMHKLQSPAVKSRGIRASLKDLNIISTSVIRITPFFLNADTGWFVLFFLSYLKNFHVKV